MKRCSALLLALVLALCLTSCGGKGDLSALLKTAWEAIGAPEITRVNHYRFDGHEAIDTQADYPVETAFGLSSVPENGHVFLLKTSSNQYAVLLDDDGKVLASVDMNALYQKNARSNETIQRYIKSTNEDYADGLISDSELQRRKAEIDRMLSEAMASSERALALAGYGVCAAICPVTEKAKANSWHELPAEMIESLFIY